MPTYSYICLSCGNVFDLSRSMKERNVTDSLICSKCKKGKCERTLQGSHIGLIFKGDGFYCTDYKNKTKEVQNI